MFRVRVPATSANLGPGFDCLGLAVDLQLEVTGYESETDRFLYDGDGSIADTPDNLVHEGFRRAFARSGRTPPRVTFEVRNPIPLARGLGSSSAALVAGAALADAMQDGALGRAGVFALAAEIEGHPDNVAPAVWGGFTVSALHEGRYVSVSLPVPDGWTLLFGIPDFELSTREARTVVPQTYARRDVIHTAARTALWVAAVTGARADLLAAAVDDVMHEPQRAALVPGFERAKRAARDAGAAAYLSGAGPTVAGIAATPAAVRALRAALADVAGPAGRVLELAPAGGYTYDPAAARTLP